MSSSDQSGEVKRSRVPGIFAFLLVLAAGVVLAYLWTPKGRSPEELAEIEELVEDAKRYTSQRRWDAVVSVADDLIKKDYTDASVMLMAGDASAFMRDYEKALDYFDRVPKDDSAESLRAAYSKCRIEFDFGTFARAEKELTELLKRSPTHLEGNQLMSRLMDLTGRRWETVPYALEVLRQETLAQKEPRQDVLLRLADQEQVVDRMKDMRDANNRDKNDPGPLLGLSRAAEFLSLIHI